jgi:hypothetical protein
MIEMMINGKNPSKIELAMLAALRSVKARKAYQDLRDVRLGFKAELAKHKTRGKLPEQASLSVQ